DGNEDEIGQQSASHQIQVTQRLNYFPSGRFQRHREHVDRNEQVAQHVDVFWNLFHIFLLRYRLSDAPQTPAERQAFSPCKYKIRRTSGRAGGCPGTGAQERKPPPLPPPSRGAFSYLTPPSSSPAGALPPLTATIEWVGIPVATGVDARA